MPIAFKCLACNTPVRMNENAAGKHVKCRKCGNLMRVPGEALLPPRDNSAQVKWAIVAACAIALIAGGILAWNYMPRAPRVVQAPVEALPKIEPDPKTAAVVEAPPKIIQPVPDTPAPKLPATPLTQALLMAPDGSLATGALIDASTLLKTLRTNLDAKLRGNASLAGTFNLIISQIQARGGLDLNDPQSLGIAGLDLSQPITIAVFDMLPDKAEPGGWALGVGLSDTALFRTSLQKAFQRAGMPYEQLSASPELIRADENGCFAIDGKEAFLIAADPEHLLQQAQQFLRNRKQKPMVETDDMSIALHGAGIDGPFAMYADLPRMIRTEKNNAPLASELRGAAISVGKEGGWFLGLDRNAAFYQLLKPGPSPKPILDRFDAPLMTVAVSLSDPVKLLQHFLHSTNQSASMVQIDTALREKTNIGLADLGDLLKDTSAGFMLFKGADRVQYAGVLFVKPGKGDQTTVGQIKKLVDVVAAEFNAMANKPGRDFVVPTATVSIVDDVVFATTSPQLLTSFQLAQANRSQSYLTPDDFFLLEIHAGEIGQTLNRSGSQAAQNPLQQIDSKAMLSTAIKRAPDGVKLYSNRSSVDITTLSVLASIAIPDLTRSRMAANEAAAVKFCHDYLKAQAGYKLLDHDSDGVLEYAQTLAGEFGLTHVEITQNIPFLPVKYAKAEGNPNDTLTPVAGYCIKILKGQGERAKGGRYTYLAGKDMTAGHAVVVYPKKYDSNGRKTFIASHDGTIYSTDLGPDTASIVELMSEFNPGPGWKPEP